MPGMKSKERSVMRQLLSKVAHNLASAVVAVLTVVAAVLCCTSLEQVAVFLAAAGGLGYMMSRRHTAQEPATFPTEEEFNREPSNFTHRRLRGIFGTDVSGVPEPHSTAGPSRLLIAAKAHPIPCACADFEASSQPFSTRPPSPPTPSHPHSPAIHRSQRRSIITTNTDTANATVKAAASATATARPTRTTRQQCARHARTPPQATETTRAKPSSSNKRRTAATPSKLDARQTQEMCKPDTPPLVAPTLESSRTATASSSGGLLNGPSTTNSPCTSMEASILPGAGGPSEGQRRFMVMHSVVEEPLNLLYHVFGQDRLKAISYPADFAGRIPSHLLEHSRCYELVSVKLQEANNAGAPFKREQQDQLHVCYLQVAGPGMARTTAQSTLEKLCNFSTLSPGKIMSRLELFQSPAVKFAGGKTCQNGVPTKKESIRGAIFELDTSLFQLLDTEGNDGCGFICEKFLSHLFGDNTAAKRVIAIQVRVLAPGLGFFKGMLMRKRHAAEEMDGGGPVVWLTPSMTKVGPPVCRETRRHSSSGQQAVMLVNGKFPSLNAQMVGRVINPCHPLQVQGRPSARVTPEPLVKRGKSDMIPRLWKANGVPSEVITEYKKQCLTWARNHHCYVVGCSDPTHAIPHDCVFVTGCQRGAPAGGGFITKTCFVTRSPCIDPEDGRVLEQLTCRPVRMSPEDWDWLLSLPFGAILFPDAPAGMKPMPTLIANGDLDGDLYFVCWDRKVLASLQDAGVVKAISYEQDAGAEPGEVARGAAAPPPENDEWLEGTWKLMMDCARTSEIRSLYPKLYNLSCQTADQHEEGLFMHHPDARAYASAFSASLDFQKHGKPIPLPEHLLQQLPRSLHDYFDC